MKKLPTGLYEEVINDKILNLISEYDNELINKKYIDKAESSLILSNYISEIIRNGLEYVSSNQDKDNITKKIMIINELITIFADKVNDKNIKQLIINFQAEQLFAIHEKQDKNKHLNRPETSLCNSSLFTGAQNEPKLYSEIQKEILSCNQIDMLVSFIKHGGLMLIYDQLHNFTQNGGKLRIITTTYMKATDIKAIEMLSELNNVEIKINYNIDKTRMHAKAYIFHRNTGYSTAYIGSSNMSRPALTEGLEWNIKITQKDMSDTMDRVKQTFESYWEDKEFKSYNSSNSEQKEILAKALDKKANIESLKFYIDSNPYPFQQEILDSLQAERKLRNNYKNLIIAATGTGKTVISAFDYKRYCEENKNKCNLLFIAHREEILKQSLETFRIILKDQNFGELYTGNNTPTQYNHLFMTVQTFKSKNFTTLTNDDFYQFIIVDETHHAAAKSYEEIFSYYKPQVLLGLTATPERADGKDIFKYFNKISAEIRLPEAIERQLLSPFHYFGVTDNVDLSSLTWSKGSYNIKELSDIYTINESLAIQRVSNIINAINKYVTNVDEIKGIGFCVSKEHAKFMSYHFNKSNIPSISLTSDSSKEERNNAKDKLLNGTYKFIFVVDLYNEGVDIPEINTVLFLRPTESLTIFLQQLGRGLRLAKNKDYLTVLDFIGQAHKKYNFEDKFTSLLHKTRKNLKNEIDNGFISLPKNCYITLEKEATKYILNNIKGYFNTRNIHIERLMNFYDETGKEPTLLNYLEHYNINPMNIYRYASFNKLLVVAKLKEEYNENIYIKANDILAKLTQINSYKFIDFIINILSNNITSFSILEKRMLQMFYFTINDVSLDECNEQILLQWLNDFKNNKVLCEEIIELLNYNKNKIDFISQIIENNFEYPLEVYCSYNRDQILSAFDFFKPRTIREGVKYLDDKKIDILLITLNKSEKNYSPTTMYKDFSRNENQFHWQSQNKTSETSVVGKRYINHKETGNRVLLFVRENSVNQYGIREYYTFLGTGNYISHKGEKPMSIEWQLDFPIPARFISTTQKLIAL